MNSGCEGAISRLKPRSVLDCACGRSAIALKKTGFSVHGSGLDTAFSDVYSKWVYARFVPMVEDVELINQAGKQLFVSGDEVSQDVNRAHDAFRAGPDMVLTWYPFRLAELVGS